MKQIDELSELINRDNNTYSDIEEFLYSLPKFTSKTDLDHTRLLLKKLGNPMEKTPKIHVAGTNGKGSVCAFLQNLFVEYGYHVGGFVSPHLVCMNERFLLDNKPVEDALFFDAFHEVFDMAKNAYYEGISYPTFFEFLFLMGMVIYEKSKIDLLILETGLGGRLDATNVYKDTCVCVLTTIGLDHCQYLGNTIEDIAKEKAGIIKKDSLVVYKKETEVSFVFEEFIKNKEAVSVPVEDSDGIFIEMTKLGIDFCYKSQYYSDICLTMSTNGLYQVENVTLALKAFESYLKKSQLEPMSVEHIRHAIAHTFWEGRMEEVLDHVFFDGAHNENGMTAFLDSVNAIPCKGKRILCFSAVNDKDYKKMVELLYKSHLFSSVVAVEMEEERGIHVDELQSIFSHYNWNEISYIKGTTKGLNYALAKKNSDDFVFIVGSLYLIGLIKKTIRGNRND